MKQKNRDWIAPSRGAMKNNLTYFYTNAFLRVFVCGDGLLPTAHTLH